MKDEPRPVPVHHSESAEPAVFHHVDVDDSTALARWLRRGLEKGPAFWLLLAGGAVVIVAAATLASGLAASHTADPEAWVAVMNARTADEALKVAEAHPDTPLALSAQLSAANYEFNQGFEALSGAGQRDLAGPRLKKALDLYRKVAAAADKKSPQAAVAAMGVARALEARNELPEAIKQYREVAANFPGTPEATRAEAMAKALEDPENVAFYKELYAYKPPTAETSISPLSTPPPSIPGMNPAIGTSPLDPSKSFLPSDILKGAGAAGPADIDPPPPTTTAPAPADAPKEATPPATPAPAPAATPKAELPAEPFGAQPK